MKFGQKIFIPRLELRERIGSPISEQEGQYINPTQGHTSQMACTLEYVTGIKLYVGGLDKNKPNSTCPLPPLCLTLVITEPAEQSLAARVFVFIPSLKFKSIKLTQYLVFMDVKFFKLPHVPYENNKIFNDIN